MDAWNDPSTYDCRIGTKCQRLRFATLIPLREILTESISTVKEREASALDELLLEHQNRVVVFGCGGLGRRAIREASRLQNSTPRSLR